MSTPCHLSIQTKWTVTHKEGKPITPALAAWRWEDQVKVLLSCEVTSRPVLVIEILSQTDEQKSKQEKQGQEDGSVGPDMVA